MHVRCELRRWRCCAHKIADPELRRLALEKLEGERLNSEAAAVFATLVPLRSRTVAVRLMVAFEVMYDYLDSVSEQPASEPVRNGLQLHRALICALVRLPGPLNYYAASNQQDDGGYLDALATACRRRFTSLPSSDVVLPVALCAAMRCGEGQARTHAVAYTGVAQLARWARRQHASGEHAWWELAAGTASSLALHALFAAAGDPRTTSVDAARTYAAYFPSVCALSTLLDSLIDCERDAACDEHSYIGYYATNLVAAERLGALAHEGQDAVRRLRQARRHVAIASGVAGFYLSSASAHSCCAGPVTERVVAALSPAVIRPILVILRLKRRGR